MASINPRKIEGSWIRGVALDVHTTSSRLVGANAQGRPQFETKRSELGELMYRLKYGGDRSAAAEIVRTAATYLRSFREKFELIVPVPPSAVRSLQPVIILARGIATAVDRPMHNCVQTTRATPQLKDVSDPEQRRKLLEGLYSVDPTVTGGKHILLVDDLFRSGSTMNAVTDVLLNQGKAASVRVLAITYTRSNK
jgi:competence protein ComFC